MDDQDMPKWRKSTESATSNCVEVARSGETVLVRDSKNRSGSVLTFTGDEWRAFLTGVRSGEFDLGPGGL